MRFSFLEGIETKWARRESSLFSGLLADGTTLHWALRRSTAPRGTTRNHAAPGTSKQLHAAQQGASKRFTPQP